MCHLPIMQTQTVHKSNPVTLFAQTTTVHKSNPGGNWYKERHGSFMLNVAVRTNTVIEHK